MRPTALTTAPPHAPALGWLARRLGPIRITGVFWYRLHRFGARRLPEWGKRLAVFLFAFAFAFLLRRIRAAVAANLEAVLGPCGPLARQRRVFRTLHTFSWCLTERYEWLAVGLPCAVAQEAGEAWDRLAAAGRGFVLTTGHVGNWEVASAVPHDLGAPRLHVVREEELDPRAQEFLAGLLAERMGDRAVTHFAVGDPRLGMALFEALGRGEVVALQGDRPRRGGKAMTLTLFGRPYAVPAGPMALARSAGAPLLPAFFVREGRRRYRVEFHPPIDVPATADREADLRAAAQPFLEALEATIRRHPHQWFCFARLWEGTTDRP
jgi:KDO2-lipid IV(A) lauroyltransferase